MDKKIKKILKENILLIYGVILILVWFTVVPFVKGLLNRGKDASADAEAKGLGMTAGERLQYRQAADTIARELGTHKSIPWYLAWADRADAYDLLVPLKGNFGRLNIYYKVFTGSLIEDDIRSIYTDMYWKPYGEELLS